MTKTRTYKARQRSSEAPKSTVRRTSLNLPVELVRDAQDVLGTRGVTDTVVKAMEEVVRFKRRLRLLAYDMSSLTDDVIHGLRRSCPGG